MGSPTIAWMAATPRRYSFAPSAVAMPMGSGFLAALLRLVGG
jgi:hypothetical protein